MPSPDMVRNDNGSWYCWDCKKIIILFDCDEHDCEVTGTSSKIHTCTDECFED